MGAETIYLVAGGLLVLAPTVGIGVVLVVALSYAVFVPSSLEVPWEDRAAVLWSGFVWTMLVILPAVVLIAWFSARLHRTRAVALLGVDLADREPGRGGPRRGRLVAYHLAGTVLGPMMLAGVLVCLIGGPTLIVFSVDAVSSVTVLPSIAVLWILAGTVVILGSPWILHALTTLDLAFLYWVFDVDEKAEMAARVRRVTESRSEAVAAADAERRKIERDLHDGAQQRLTALAVHLGLERLRMSRQPEDGGGQELLHVAQEAMTYAQSEVETALQEIRDLVRGLHPAVLEDRGLDAAVSGLASRVPFPVTVEVDVPRRPPEEVEAVAYFVVSEAINNAIAHSRAEHGRITVNRTADTVVVEVDDDGIGGADERRGSGLVGLRRRVGSVDGTMEIRSTPGRGTRIRVELPCASS